MAKKYSKLMQKMIVKSRSEADIQLAELERTMRIVGHTLRDVRIQAGITRLEAAKRSGLSVVAISRIENGQKLPYLSAMRALSSAYDLGVKSLLKMFRYRATVPDRVRKAHKNAVIRNRPSEKSTSQVSIGNNSVRRRARG